MLGVYCPITKKELCATFKTTTPRVVTLALDFNERNLKFWLNDKLMENRTIKLEADQTPLVPFAKLNKEKKQIILNPYAKIPPSYWGLEPEK